MSIAGAVHVQPEAADTRLLCLHAPVPRGYAFRPNIEVVSGVYGILNLQTGKIYIGQSADVLVRLNIHRRRLNRGRHVNKHLQAAWCKYGEQTFEFRVLERCSVSELAAAEAAWILRCQANVSDYGYNQDRGGGGTLGCRSSRPATRRRTRSEAARQRGPRSEATRKKMSESARNRPPISDETRKKLVMFQRNRRATTHVSAETRRRLSEAARRRGADYRQRMSVIRKQWWERQRRAGV